MMGNGGKRSDGSGPPSGSEGLRKGRAASSRAAGAQAGSGEDAQGGSRQGRTSGDLISFLEHFAPIEQNLDRDLFGLAIRPGAGKPGRPVHMPSPETRRTVRDLRAAGALQLEIAKALGISLPTLRLNYAIELQSTSQTWRRRAARNAKSSERKS